MKSLIVAMSTSSLFQNPDVIHAERPITTAWYQKTERVAKSLGFFEKNPEKYCLGRKMSVGDKGAPGRRMAPRLHPIHDKASLLLPCSADWIWKMTRNRQGGCHTPRRSSRLGSIGGFFMDQDTSRHWMSV
jgi:hypothetical protein